MEAKESFDFLDLLLSLGLSDSGIPVRQAQINSKIFAPKSKIILETSSDFMTVLGTAKPCDLSSEKSLV